MFTAKFIKNLVYNGETIRAIGRSGSPTRVLAVQGDLDGSCSVYCLMMMLIFHQKLDWEDLIDRERAKENAFVDTIQRHFLFGLNGLYRGGHSFKSISNRLNQCLGMNLSEVFTTCPGKTHSISRRRLHLKIKVQLDTKRPVLLGYQREGGKGHALVAIGYRWESKHRLRLFCLDPGHSLPRLQVWNNIIDLDYLSYIDWCYSDFNYYQKSEVCVNNILLIHDEIYCPF